MTDKIFDRTLCPACWTPLDAAFGCPACGQAFPRLGSIRVLLADPAVHIECWRRQLGFIIQQGTETAAALESQATEPGVGSATQTRLRTLARAVGEQVADVALVLGAALDGPLSPYPELGLPRGATDYMTCLFRDWAWSNGQDEENQRSLAAVRRVVQGRPLERTLVLGAGGCRLAYDLHLHCGGTDTVVVDVDPYLLVMAEAVIRGAAVTLTETSANAPEIDPVSRRWTLAAPSGPLADDTFHFFLANGTEPPFSDAAFDTIVTPWFIDQVPTDLAGLIRRLHRLLAPGGRWINHGPLIYRPDALRISQWYSREEIFELASAAGFRIGASESASQPHFVSPLTGRGLIENVLTFEAARD